MIGAFVLGACSAPTWIDDPSAPLPERLSELGVYPDVGELETLHPRAIAYEPLYPLWSNGSDKQRFIILPDGATIDNSEHDAWVFPEGTLLVKTFSYEGRPIETRVIRLLDGEWRYDVYGWDDDGKDATHVDIARPRDVPVDAFGTRFDHAIPSERHCRTCHEANGTRVLGFSELQLGAELEALAERGLLAHPAPSPERIEGHDPLTTAVLGYLQGNCVHCHNGRPGSANAFDMRHDVALSSLVGVMTASGAVEPGLRVAPGDPDASVLLQLFREESALAMPPLGVQRRDEEMADVFREWILGLE